MAEVEVDNPSVILLMQLAYTSTFKRTEFLLKNRKGSGCRLVISRKNY
ncbi:hypothetical protein AAHH67_13770 [Niallia circulans]